MPQKSRYKKKLVTIPTPEFYFFYNGTEPYPDIKTLRLSDSFIIKQKKHQLDLTVDVYNIADPHPEKPLTLLDKCDILKQYCEFVETVRSFKENDSANPITEAISYCIKNDILSEYLKRKSTEVNNLLIANYDFEIDKKVYAEEAAEDAYAEGMLEGKLEEKKENALRMLKGGKLSIEEIAEYTGITIEKVKELQKDL